MSGAQHVPNRDVVVDGLRRELVGPSPQGKEIDTSGEVAFEAKEASYGPWRQSGSGEEILTRDTPCKRYGVGVLYPIATEAGTPGENESVDIPERSNPAEGDILTEEGAQALGKILEKADAKSHVSELSNEDSSQFDLTGANAYNPSTMGVSFLVELPAKSELVVVVECGRYRAKQVHVAGVGRTWWIREPVSMRCTFSRESLCKGKRIIALPTTLATKSTDGLQLSVEAIARPYDGQSGQYLITCYVVNRTHHSGSTSEQCVFQVHMSAGIGGAEGPQILPYPGGPSEKLDEEEQSLALLYRRAETFGVGHGCAADWNKADSRRAWSVTGESLPVCETPSITPDVKDVNGKPIEVRMAPLAGLVSEDDGFSALSRVVEQYKAWIDGQEREIPGLEERFQPAARRHVAECRRAVLRMEKGLQHLSKEGPAKRAFQLANHAMLLQQVRSTRDPRIADYEQRARRFIFRKPYQEHDLLNPGPDKGKWRAFQIAFLLMSVCSAAEGDAPDRSTVELIWFPTGGGKTEAYLALAAFTMFYRRLLEPADSGVSALMRYTLRLLTAQQFQRASALICAMEHLRGPSQTELGSAAFSIGIWVGSSTTPNTRKEALRDLRSLQKDEEPDSNPFVLTKCPWCSAQMGVSRGKGKPPKGVSQVRGYSQRGDTVALECPDQACPFSQGLPIYVIDEDIYERRPSLIIGTVDKFAQLAWKASARALFGLAENGHRSLSPPGLIIQDELHLISGPLGSMVGLYEPLIEELCTDRRAGKIIAPKIVSSTATIRRYRDQIKALYGREEVSLFPPPGLDAGDSFFARYALNPDNSLQRGRQYVGVHAPALGSMQTVQVRTFTSLLQTPTVFDPVHRDPWWTLLIFFNSLRELGTTLSLYQSDIPNYFKILRMRDGIDFTQLRRLWDPKELTGRLQSDEVPQAIEDLEVPCTSTERRPVDVCLASNIIEVGIDIDRLSVMAVVGQPKTTSQYIQVTGRVGRKWYERPGLVVTLYGASKPRDRSHYEKFRSYHERLYAHVEPTSVTPFSPPVLDRALHAVLAAYARQAGRKETAESPYPYPPAVIEAFRDLFLPRVKLVDKEEASNFEKVLNRRSKEWKQWERTRWNGSPQDADASMLRDPGQYTVPSWAKISWPTPTSMRNVDAECQAEITQLYLSEDPENA